jgi:hypothetical protein
MKTIFRSLAFLAILFASAQLAQAAPDAAIEASPLEQLHTLALAPPAPQLPQLTGHAIDSDVLLALDFEHPPAILFASPLPPQATQPCGTGVTHCTVLDWAASPSAASCTSPCTFGYNAFRGTASGAESATPLNSTLISGLSYIDPITLTSNPQSFYYVVQAVETSQGVTASSVNSNEVSDTFPGIPSAPATPTATAP